MSEADRARERLDFEAAAEAIEKGKGKKIIDPLTVFLLPAMNEQRFVAPSQLEVYGHFLLSLILINLILSFIPNADPWKFYEEFCGASR